MPELFLRMSSEKDRKTGVRKIGANRINKIFENFFVVRQKKRSFGRKHDKLFFFEKVFFILINCFEWKHDSMAGLHE